MKQKWNLELSVGVFMIIGFLCFSYVAVKLGKVNIFGGKEYPVFALFSSVSGLKEGAVVEIAGVTIGRVADISLGKDDMAKVEMRIKPEVKLPNDVIVSIRTQGIIGDKYIKIKPGASDKYVLPGAYITDTESAIDLEELISKYIFGKI
ncbi:MAG: outer membrane lipid asymmetry maintenance protein MlaD [Deltaproteobacteria bacterium]|nr:outer membrane lipid asymmetry maintenance protein MlaD [Deltaproteobacteria bacterium]